MISKTDYKFFLKARYAANISDYKKIHIGCVAVYHGKIIGIGCNCNKTHPFQKNYNRYREYSDTLLPKMHAEINCLNQIKDLNIKFSKVKLYIYRARKDKDFGMSRPCPSCMAAIKDFGIREIYYTTNDGYSYEKLDKMKGGAA